MVIWIIGESGSGKSFLARKLFKEFNSKKVKVYWIDGDLFRKKYSRDLGYTTKDRKKNSLRIQKHCKIKEINNDIILCSILSIFKKHQKKNRRIYKKYFQIYIKANKKILKKRNNKNIYSKKKNVVGKDIKFPCPYKSDMIITNKFNKNFILNVKKIVKKVYEKL
tara:strand:- start:214 stop:708 length:495 start_codon:yes stop_codon:yes gene_type:complete